MMDYEEDETLLMLQHLPMG